MGNWQPIDTAPKTGARIIGTWGNGYVGIMQWLGPSVFHPDGVWSGDEYVIQGTPSHWMPLPEVPK